MKLVSMERVWVGASVDKGVLEPLIRITTKEDMINIFGELFAILTKRRNVHSEPMEVQICLEFPMVGEPEEIILLGHLVI